MQIASWMVTVTVVIKKYAVIIFVFSYYKISIEEITSWLYLQIQSLLLRYLRLKLCLNSYIYNARARLDHWSLSSIMKEQCAIWNEQDCSCFSVIKSAVDDLTCYYLQTLPPCLLCNVSFEALGRGNM